MEEAAAKPAAVTPVYPSISLLLLPLTGISQIVGVKPALSEGIIVGGIAMNSPGLTAHAVVGSTIGAVLYNQRNMSSIVHNDKAMGKGK